MSWLFVGFSYMAFIFPTMPVPPFINYPFQRLYQSPAYGPGFCRVAMNVSLPKMIRFEIVNLKIAS